ncbi:interleukin-1 receptor type 1 isoform X9 [Ctenopharyngodon idella]|uniref:interleukin-1 receptor type 1 isoform X3 n=2 Tax=Ctenopharyngodon idella TaxID=7959 RepID=UPI0022313252|nr:interleukin-1 receptor type 1 isoform X3 [Ctenopharyngodon idella]XP_051761724.1 interleukin-1 receptor type 1 isoform X4 [Ctenopharyngodon idella]XP_051761726.1 interleukin-1 receptor type 1 isoform X5 [Ctenopharyngodon idella]XP_051761729.1 interleukin-1 receptor type 1 isoform X8 [Ctenopharyngodon idella]XP_051761730.1 interleukin-1 receptor type 1 isoform X9 [Ctenopharyngodon idella]
MYKTGTDSDFIEGNHDALGRTVDMGRLSLVFLLAFLRAAECAVISNKDPSGSDSCKDYGQAFERIFAVPGESPLLECPLQIQSFFDPAETPYNVTWLEERNGSEVMKGQPSVVVRKQSLWFPNISMEQQGTYTCVIWTQSQCFRQAAVLVVSEMTSGQCERPQSGIQMISAHVNDVLSCPLRRYLKSVDHPSIQWYKNCEPLPEDEKFVLNKDKDILNIRNVHLDDAGFYTCKMTFSLDGVVGEMAESIECLVHDEYLEKPRVIEPAGEIIRVESGSSIRKNCVVVVAGNGGPMVEVLWKIPLEFEEVFVSQNMSDRIHQEPMNESKTENGYVFVRTLSVSDVSWEDFYLNFICMASSSRGHPTGHFTLVPMGPNLLLLLGLLLGSVAVLFVVGVLVCTIFKVELVLWLRTMFPFLYKTTDGDGKQYDAYIAYPRVLEGSSEKAEIFAMSTLPQVLEGLYGYKLFILGRDGLPGEAVVDVVQDALSRCRRLLLLYTASSLCSPEAQEWAEQQTGLYQAIVENSMSIVLLELEEIREPGRLPPSVRLLKEKQGALQAWKRRKRWMGWDRKLEDRSTSLDPPACFWREVRYHMPVRGKAKERNWFSF